MSDSRQKNPNDVLQSYRRWKEQGEALKSQAQGFLVERFHELVQEAQQVQHDLYEDFGHVAKFPVNPKFAKKGRGRAPLKKPSASATKIAAPAQETKSAATQKASGSGANLRMPRDEKSKKLELLNRQVEKARQRLADAKASGSAVKIQNAEDKLYELSDELRLIASND